jgi:hypothetical protein
MSNPTSIHHFFTPHASHSACDSEFNQSYRRFQYSVLFTCYPCLSSRSHPTHASHCIKFFSYKSSAQLHHDTEASLTPVPPISSEKISVPNKQHYDTLLLLFPCRQKPPSAPQSCNSLPCMYSTPCQRVIVHVHGCKENLQALSKHWCYSVCKVNSQTTQTHAQIACTPPKSIIKTCQHRGTSCMLTCTQAITSTTRY